MVWRMVGSQAMAIAESFRKKHNVQDIKRLCACRCMNLHESVFVFKESSSSEGANLCMQQGSDL